MRHLIQSTERNWIRLSSVPMRVVSRNKHNHGLLVNTSLNELWWYKCQQYALSTGLCKLKSVPKSLTAGPDSISYRGEFGRLAMSYFNNKNNNVSTYWRIYNVQRIYMWNTKKSGIIIKSAMIKIAEYWFTGS